MNNKPLDLSIYFDFPNNSDLKYITPDSENDSPIFDGVVPFVIFEAKSFKYTVILHPLHRLVKLSLISFSKFLASAESASNSL